VRLRSLAGSLAAAGLTVLLLAACGPDAGTTSSAAGSATSSSSAPTTPAGNGEAAKTGPQVAADAATALEQAGAVHAVGTSTSDGAQDSVDLHFQGTDLSGTITEAGSTVEVISTGGRTYVKAPAAFWKAQQVPSSVARKLNATWVLVPAEGGNPAGDLSLASMAAKLRTPDKTSYAPQVQKGTYQGRDVVVITESDGSTTQVAATGTPYPLQSTDRSSEPGTVTLTDFGVRVPITAPADFLDLSTLGG
jgi:hypothetical protein